MEHSNLVSKLVHLCAVGGPCYTLYSCPKNNEKPCWVPAVVTKVFGTLSVSVRIFPTGPTCTWHQRIDQLCPCSGVEEGADPGEAPKCAVECHNPKDVGNEMDADSGNCQAEQSTRKRWNHRLQSDDQYRPNNLRCAE